MPFNITTPLHGLYSFGSVPNDGFMKSACVFGNIDDGDKGVVYIFVIQSDGEVRSFHRVEMTPMKPCLNMFDNNQHPRKGDLLTVYIPKNPHSSGNTTNQPLQISFYNRNNSRKYQFLDLSDINETSFQSIQKGITTALMYWNWKDLEDPNLDLNIQVSIINTTISCKSLIETKLIVN